MRVLRRHSIEARRNDRLRFVAVYHDSSLIRNHGMTNDAVGLLGGVEMLDTLYKRVASELGADVRDRVFGGVELPVLGTPPLEWVRTTAVVMPRLEAEADPATVNHVLDHGISTC